MQVFSDSKLCCLVFITKTFSWCLLFELSVTVIEYQPSGITLESSYSVIAFVDSVNHGLPIMAYSRRVNISQVAAESS